MRHNESDIQIACVSWFRLSHPNLSPLLFAVPNGGVRNVVTAARLKKEGVVAGVADLLLLVPRSGCHGLCIEMKAKEGRQQKTQKEWQRHVEAQGYRYVVCHSFDDFFDAVKSYLTP